MDKNKDICIINCQGYDGGGSLTASIFFSRAFNCDLWIKDSGRLKDTKDEFDEIIPFKKEYSQITDINTQYKLIILTSLALQKGMPNKTAKEIREHVPNSKIYFLELKRRMATKGFQGYDEVYKYVDGVVYYTGCPNMNLWENVDKFRLDVNLFEFCYEKEIVPLKDRLSYVFSASRFMGFKGFGQYFDSITTTDFLSHPLWNDNLLFWKGPVYNFNSNGKLSGEIGFITAVCKDTKTKEMKDGIVVHNSPYNPTLLEKRKMNLFQSYTHNDKRNWEKFLVGICPTMGRRREFDYEKESKRLEKNKPYWELAIEYTNLEMIEAGTPVLFSKDYLETYCPELLETGFYFEFYEDIPDVIAKFTQDENIYRNIILTQRKLIKEKLKKVEKGVKEFFLAKLEE